MPRPWPPLTAPRVLTDRRLLPASSLRLPGRIEISAQNHNFAVDPATLPPEAEVSLINLNDGTCAGLLHPGLKAMTVQSHPEASPGPHDSDVAFEQFIGFMAEARA